MAAAAFAGPRARHHHHSADRSHRVARSADAARDHGAGAGVSGRETLQLATDNARLMLPYLAFAGPVTVMMALLNAQGRFALTAFSPLLFNIALIAVMAVLLAVSAGCRAAPRRSSPRPSALPACCSSPCWCCAVARHRDAVAGFVRQGNPRLSRQGRARHDGIERAAVADGGRRDHRLVVAVGGVVALFRQPAGRTAARHCRRRHGHGADPGTDARGAGDGPRRRRACGIARPRTRGRAGAAGDARPDRAQRADRAAAVRARRLHRRRHAAATRAR